MGLQHRTTQRMGRLLRLWGHDVERPCDVQTVVFEPVSALLRDKDLDKLTRKLYRRPMVIDR